MRAFIFTGLTAFALLGCSAADSVDPNGPTVTQADFESVVGEAWTGELTYLDYSSEKRVTIPAAATIKLAGSNGIKYTISYPEEPWEDTKSTLKTTQSGRVFDGHPVIARDTAPNGWLTIQTLHQGEDNKKPADIRMSYRVGENDFVIEKEVSYGADGYFITRKSYHFTRP